MEKVKYTLEFVVNSSKQVLYSYIATVSGLSDWFADNVTIKDDLVTFEWDGTEEIAKLITRKPGENIKLHWLDDDDDNPESYFELKIVKNPLTKGNFLVITDFAEEDEIEEAKDLWKKQIDDLFHKIGA